MRSIDLQRALPGWQVHAFSQIESTQDYAKRIFRQQPDFQQPLLVAADEQTAGYGRYGREFFSPKSTGIYISIGLPKPICPPGLFTISLSVTVAHVLDQHFPAKKVQFKWVNDLYLNRKKVGGLLVEQVSNMLVCGIGINLSPVSFPIELQTKAGSLTDNHGWVPLPIIKDLAIAIKAAVPTYASGMLLPEYRQRLLILNHVVTAKVDHRLITGRVENITSTGSLILQTAKGRIIINSGEVIKINF